MGGERVADPREYELTQRPRVGGAGLWSEETGSRKATECRVDLAGRERQLRREGNECPCRPQKPECEDHVDGVKPELLRHAVICFSE